ncbi:MAG TPA: PP2C family protein-serine/threonine phosphatase [Thermoanaerobaculia bacterium]
MRHGRIQFDPVWAIASIAIGIIFTLTATVGAGKAIDLQFLAYGGFIGLCIYTANVALHRALDPYVSRMRTSLIPSARISISILGGIVGWQIGYLILVFAETGRLVFPMASGRMRWLLLVTVAISVLVAAFAQGYHQLRERLSDSIEKLKEREYQEKELELARSIQSRLLPPPRIEGDGFLITARNLPAHFVAGDFYDVLRHDDGSVGIVVADVSGKGIGSSLIMASVKAVLPFLANGSVDETLRALNERLIAQLDRREFVALAYARFQPASGTLRLANAGMPDPYLFASSVTPIVVGGARLPLGVRHDVQYESIELQLERGDRLLLLSDGIPEAPRPNGEPFGYDELQEMLASMPAHEGWIDTLIERVRAQVRGVDDDWTVVVLERR